MMVRINAVLREDIVEGLDDIGRELHKNRSQLLREAAERLIEEHRRKQEQERRLARRRQAAVAQDRLREKSGKWDGTAEVAKWRRQQR